MTVRQLRLTFPGRPILANDGGHWTERASRVAPVRQLAGLAGRGMLNDPMKVQVEWEGPAEGIFLVPVAVHAYAIQPTSARRWVDADAIAPMVKAVLDGLVDAKLLEDDGPRFVRSYHYEIARRGPAWATVIEVRETDGESACPW